ncbi:hypothetical protein [Mycoplasmopsis cynos]|uniref:hypothetical protein n=1 Tax=Mycoplasmopsis cynos TaxID=171284 RepID=UPI001CB7AB7D|nr:hypothetical protein [Mycoplasmopsis cynos]
MKRKRINSLLKKKIKYEEIIIKNFFNNNERHKRRLAYYIFKMHNIKINPRTLKNYMKKLHLVTFVGQKKKKKRTLMLNLKI